MKKSDIIKVIREEILNELEYTPHGLLQVNDLSEELGKTFKKLAHGISRDLDSKENRAVGQTLKAYNAYFVLLKKMKPLFEGLNELYRQKISHLDIKVNNIVIHKGVFKYIDFGLSSKLSESDHFKNRSISEFNNTRFYLWYPTDYIYSHASKSDLKDEISNMKRRKHCPSQSKTKRSLRGFADISRTIMIPCRLDSV